MFDYEIREKRDLVFIVLSVLWLFAPLVYYFHYLREMTPDELTNHVEMVASYVPDEFQVMVILWPWVGMLIGIGLTNLILRVISRLWYGRWA